MKKIIGIILAALLLTGCNTFMIVNKDYEKGELTKKVWAIKCDLLAVNETKGLDIDYQGVKIKLDSQSSKGDKESIEALGKAITEGIMAYMTYGAEPAVQAAIIAALNKAKTNKVEKVESPK